MPNSCESLAKSPPRPPPPVIHLAKDGPSCCSWTAPDLALLGQGYDGHGPLGALGSFLEASSEKQEAGNSSSKASRTPAQESACNLGAIQQTSQLSDLLVPDQENNEERGDRNNS